MEPSLLLYNLLLNTAGYAAVKTMISRSPEEQEFWKGRMGDYGAAAVPAGSPRIWCHAASVGEVSGALPTLTGLLSAWPGAVMVLTVGTWQGYRAARTRAPESVAVLPFPLDFRRVLEKAFLTIRPDLYIAFESEFWPNLAAFLRKGGVPPVLLNGRVTRRSLERYRLMKPLFRPIFSQFEWLAMHSEEDRRHVLKLGSRPERTLVLGSSKYEGLSARVDPAGPARWREVLQLPEDVVTVIGGSLRRSECTAVLDVFLQLARTEPRLAGLFVPRHLEQIPNMVRWLEGRNVPFQLFSRIEAREEPRRESVVLVDRIGILFELYGMGDLIFCGGTLEPIGGHNILEPSAWRKPVFYGPHVEKVRHEHLTLQSFGGSFEVRDAGELLQTWSNWLGRLDVLRRHGERAGDALRSLGGVVERQVGLVRSVLEGLR
jgi:3-deoxy-D-manno-octulosonic-acid transferase